MREPDEWDDYGDDLPENDDWPDDECGLMPDGQCLKAGSEECDWECGRLNAARIARMKEARRSTVDPSADAPTRGNEKGRP